MDNWEKFTHGQLVLRVDGGPAGVYWCDTVEEYQKAVFDITRYEQGTGLYTSQYYTPEGKRYGESDGKA